MKQKTSRTLKHRVIRKIEVHFEPASDDEDYFQSDDKDNMRHIKDSVINMVDYSANSTEYHPAGPLVITPHYLKNVPNEVASLIMDYLVKEQPPHLKQKDLYQCALVSKQFYRIANPMLWHTPTISKANVLEQLTRSLASAQMDKTSLDILGNHLQRLDIQGPYWNDIDFSFMLPFIRSLGTLTIADDAKNITCASLKHLPRSCPHLTSLYLFYTPITSTITDSIRQHCHQLRQIGLSTEGLSIDTFKKLAKCPLKTIALNCNLIHTTNPRVVPSVSGIYDSIIDDIKTFDQLTHLSFGGRGAEYLTNTVFSINDTVAWPRLATLHIARQISITDNAFISFIKSHRDLKHLDLDIQLSDSALHAIVAHLPKLTRLLLHNNNMITRRGVYHLIRHCNHLKQVDFINCHHIVNTMPEFFDAKSNGVILDAEKMKQIRQEDQQ